MAYPATPKTWVAGDVLTAAQLNAELRDALLGTFPLGPPDAAWTAWTPTLTGITVGNGVRTSTYTRIGRTVHYYFRFVFGSTSAVTGAAGFTLPVAPLAPRDNADHYGLVVYSDFGTAQSFGPAIYVAGTVFFKHGGPTNVSNLSATAPFTWAVNDAIVATGAYESAT